MASGVLPTHLGLASAHPERGCSCCFDFIWCPCTSLQPTPEVTHALQSHTVTVEIEAKGEVGVGDPQMHTDQWMMVAFTSVE